MAKHLSLSERALIERALVLGKSFSEIAASLDRSPSTVSREVKNHRVFVSRWRDDKNDCLSYPSWVSDFTYFEVQGKWMYLCVVIDLYSRRVISYRISRSASKNLVSKTFLNAYRKRGRPKNLVFHSDRGTQYTAKAFTDLLMKLGIKQSFSAPGNPIDNAVSESFFATFKKEEAFRRNYTSERSFIDGVANYIEFFNNERQHETLNYHTPVEFESKFRM